MKFAKFLIIVALCSAAFAQQAAPAEQRSPKVFAVKYASVERLAKAFEIFGPAKFDSALKILIIDGTPATHAAIAEALKTLDVPPVPIPVPVVAPPKNVELTFHIIYAGANADPQRKLPADLDAVARNLSTLFGYKNFTLIETAQVRVKDGNMVSTSGTAPFVGGPKEFPTTYSLVTRTSVQAIASGYSVSMGNLRFSLKVPVMGAGGTVQFRDSGINTDIDVRDGQKVVVGKANMDGSDGSIVLVVTAKVVE